MTTTILFFRLFSCAETLSLREIIIIKIILGITRSPLSLYLFLVYTTLNSSRLAATVQFLLDNY